MPNTTLQIGLGLIKVFVACALLSSSYALAGSLNKTNFVSTKGTKAGSTEDTPANLARWHMGASLILVKDTEFQRIQMPDLADFDESIFLSSNSALTYKITSGSHRFIIDLGSCVEISRFFLNNQTAAGEFTIAASNTLQAVESEEWVTLAKKISFKGGVIPSTTFPETSTRYLLISLKIKHEGTIGNFGATGPLSATHAKAYQAIPFIKENDS